MWRSGLGARPLESMTPELRDRRDWRLLWLSSIQAFADARGSGFSFTDCMSSYFDEVNLGQPDAYEKRLEAGDVNSAEATAVRSFHSLVETYESPNADDLDDQTILQDPQWREIVVSA